MNDDFVNDDDLSNDNYGGRKPSDKENKKGGNGIFLGFLIGMIVSCIAAIFVLYSYKARCEKIMQDYYDSLKGSESISDGGEKSISEISEKMELLQSYIDQYFLFEEDYPEVAESVYKAMIEALDDPYSSYFTSEEYAALMESTSGKYVGIGATVSKDEDTGYVRIVSMFDDSGAKESGLHDGDLITDIDGTSTVDLDLSSAAALMKGVEGTTVDIKVFRPDTEESLSFTITRKQIEMVTVAGEMLDDNIGYIVISEFDGVTADQFKDILDDLTEQGMKGLIVDLRNNPGGLLTSVNDILDLLLPKGLLVYTEDKYGNRQEYNSDAEWNDVPMAVLVNGNSASASEIFAGAVKDHKRATLVGTKTFGKGIVQTIRKLPDGSAIKLTIARYYTPNGVCIHGEGITPDVVVELDTINSDSEEEMTWKDDNQLKAAYDILTGK